MVTTEQNSIGNAEILLGKLKEKGCFFVDENNKVWVALNEDCRRSVVPIKSKSFKAWVSKAWLEMSKKLPNPSAVSSVIDMLESLAILKDDKRTLHPRITKEAGAIWYYLNDEHKRAVRIDDWGWSIKADGLPLFREPYHLLPQVMPCGGDAKRLLDFMNLSNDEHELLFLVTVISCFIPNIEHPVIVFHGSKGAAKTTTMAMVQQIVDPSSEKSSSVPRGLYDLGLHLSQSYFVAYDNLSNLTPSQSDMMCKFVTGGSVTKKENYTDEDMIRVNFQGCLALNGINLVATRGDLLDRAVTFTLERISEKNRRSKHELERDFKEALPGIMGGIFSTVSKAMAIYPNVSLDELPRMADFCKWGCAIAEALGHTTNDFVAAYNNNIRLNQASAIENNLLAKTISVLLEDKPEWEGLVSGLYEELKAILLERGFRKDRTFPLGANKLMYGINEVRSDLEAHGIMIERLGRSNKGERIRITSASYQDGVDGAGGEGTMQTSAR